MTDDYTAPEEMSDQELYDEYQEAKEFGTQLRLDELMLEVAQRWEAEHIAEKESDENAPDMELVAQALRNLIAIERDRRLGYAYEDLHMDPVKALENGMVALDELGGDPCDVVWEDDREALRLENPWDDFADGEGPELV